MLTKDFQHTARAAMMPWQRTPRASDVALRERMIAAGVITPGVLRDPADPTPLRPQLGPVVRLDHRGRELAARDAVPRVRRGQLVPSFAANFSRRPNRS